MIGADYRSEQNHPRRLRRGQRYLPCDLRRQQQLVRAWAFWQAEIYRHRDVRLMNGGRKKWLC
jgi:hypothetical protein